MFILLLPPVQPPEPTIGPSAPRVELTPGLRVTAVVLQPDLEGRSMLHFAGRDVASHQPLPFAPGTRLRLEVLEGGESPTVRVLWPDGPAASHTVSARTYGLAAAVLAAQHLPDWHTARTILTRWLPLLVTRGVLTQPAASGLAARLTPVVTSEVPGQRIPDGATLAAALAVHLPGSGLLLERQMAQALRHDRPPLPTSDRGDLRQQLAALSRDLHGHPEAVPSELMEALETTQQGLLGEQARTAAHYARDGALDMRIPLLIAGRDVDLRLRLEPDEPSAAHTPGAVLRVVRVDLVLPGLGRLQVVVGWSPHRVRTEVFTESADAAEAVERGLATLTSALQDAGFTEVLSRVVVDPVRLVEHDLVPQLPSEGSIVSADA